MAEFYNAETLLEFVKQNTPHIDGETTMKCVERAILKAPTADVVEAVRCKDCEHWNGIGFAENAGWCEKKDIGTIYNHFCSYGERK